MEARRAKGLCFNCDESYVQGHRCKKLLEISEDLEAEVDTGTTGRIEETEEASIHTITGAKHPKTMQVLGHINQTLINILVDSGSTHCFIDNSMAIALGLHVQRRDSLKVTVANGGHLQCSGFSPNVHIKLGDFGFSMDLFLIPLGEFGLVLGVNWLSLLGPISWDFKHMTMEFCVEGSTICLQGLSNVTATTSSNYSLSLPSASNPGLKELLEKYSAIFTEPRSLPSERACNHKIILSQGTDPIAVRPYRYPHTHKDEIERQCEDMLARGIIRPSTSPFSAPVLLVRKADASWRFCVDYRALNSRTIKDKFPIPVIDELLEELNGAQYFTKLDLRAGFHQVLMDTDSIPRTAFRTHHGHFEFLVMPFGLTNAPSTFQALKNTIFARYLRRFVLIFFDDILIFSST